MIKILSTFKTGINRKKFLVLFALLVLFIFIVHYSVLYFYDVSNIEAIDYFILKSILSFVYFLMFLPLAIARLKDAGLSPYWSLFLFVSAIFDFRNIILAQELWGIYIEIASIPIALITLGAFVLLLVLFFKKGSHNKQLNKDAPKNGAPVS